MASENMTVSLRMLLQIACTENARREMETLPTPRELERRYPDTTDLTGRVLGAVKARRTAAKTRRHSLRMARRAVSAAAILMSLLFCTMMASASIRTAVVNTIIEWTEQAIGIQFETEGESPLVLPENYGPHYIPEGLVYQKEVSWTTDDTFLYVYQSEDKSSALSIQGGIAQNNAGYWIDNEHIQYQQITFNDAPAYLGTFDNGAGYVMVWVEQGVEIMIYFESDAASLSELYQIAENIY